MNTTKIEWSDVNLPINKKLIQELEEGYYLIKTMEEYEVFSGFDEKTMETTFEKRVDYKICLLAVFQAKSGNIGVINGSFAYEHNDKTIIGISKLEG